MASHMGEAIALSSPSGRMSKRARKAAIARLGKALFPDGIPAPLVPQYDRKYSLLRRARELRELADRGMHPRLYRKTAAKWEAEAATL
jgi:hypothetical protein